MITMTMLRNIPFPAFWGPFPQPGYPNAGLSAECRKQAIRGRKRNATGSGGRDGRVGRPVRTER